MSTIEPSGVVDVTFTGSEVAGWKMFRVLIGTSLLSAVCAGGVVGTALDPPPQAVRVPITAANASPLRAERNVFTAAAF